MKKSVTVFGVGQIGLPVAIAAAMKGYSVYGVDLNKQRIDQIRNLDPKIGDQTVLFFLRDQKIFNNISLPEKIVKSTDFYVIAVPTKLNDDFSCDTLIIENVIFSIIPHLKIGATIILESTVPVGFTDNLAQAVYKNTKLVVGRDIFFAYTAERLLTGQAMQEFINNDRVIGGVTSTCSQRAAEFYEPIVVGKIILATAKEVELCKIVENSYRLVNLSFANQISELASQINLSPNKIISLANLHPRVNILKPGIGIGGDCVGVHPYFLQESFNSIPSLIKTSLSFNQNRPSFIARELEKEIDKLKLSVSRPLKVVAIGLGYKPDSGDVRNSPALKIASLIKKVKNIKFKVFEPHLYKNEILDLGFEPVSKMSEIENCDVLIVLVAHKVFKTLKETLSRKQIVLDPCELLFPNEDNNADAADQNLSFNRKKVGQ